LACDSISAEVMGSAHPAHRLPSPWPAADVLRIFTGQGAGGDHLADASTDGAGLHLTLLPYASDRDSNTLPSPGRNRLGAAAIQERAGRGAERSPGQPSRTA